MTQSDIHTLFVFVRTDLPLADQIVQVGHVCATAGTAFAVAPACRLVLIGLRDIDALHQAERHCKYHKIKTVSFHEPDSASDDSVIPMGMTAVCTEPLDEQGRRSLRKFKLWKEQPEPAIRK